MSNTSASYENLNLFIDGKFTAGDSGAGQDVMNPANAAVLARVPHAKKPEIDKALAAADKGFKTWRKINAFERAKILRKAADLMRERHDMMAKIMVLVIVVIFIQKRPQGIFALKGREA